MRYAINQTKYLLESEVEDLERVLLRNLDTDERNAVLLLTLLYTGARASECLQIRAGDVANGAVLVRGLKGSDDREVPVPDFLFERLVCLQNRHIGKLFKIGYKRLVQIWGIYRPVPKKLHALRHTFAIRQLRKHGRLDVIKKLLGHRNIQNTMVYADYAYTQDEFRRLVV